MSCQRGSISEKAADIQFRDLVHHNLDHYTKHPYAIREGLHFFDSAFRCIPEPGNEDYTLFYHTQASLAQYAELHDLSNRYADSLETILKPRLAHSTYDLEKYAGILFLKGDNCMALGKYSEAFFNYFKAKRVLTENTGGCLVSHYAHRIGLVMYKQKRYQEAKNLFAEAFLKSGDCDEEDLPETRQQAMLDNMALCYFHLHQDDSALIFCDSALTYIATHRELIRKK